MPKTEDQPGDSAILREAKTALRGLMLERRASISKEEREARAAEIERRLFELPEVAAARTVMAFRSFGSEVPTDGIEARLLDERRRVLLPAVEGDRMEAVEYRTGAPMLRAAYGAMEPAERTPVDPAEVDLVVAPGLAFDRSGNRLGYGGAYFDSFLRRVRAGCPAVGISFHEQVVDRVPTGLDDVPVDVVVTDNEVIRTKAG